MQLALLAACLSVRSCGFPAQGTRNLACQDLILPEIEHLLLCHMHDMPPHGRERVRALVILGELRAFCIGRVEEIAVILDDEVPFRSIEVRTVAYCPSPGTRELEQLV